MLPSPDPAMRCALAARRLWPRHLRHWTMLPGCPPPPNSQKAHRVACSTPCGSTRYPVWPASCPPKQPRLELSLLYGNIVLLPSSVVPEVQLPVTSTYGIIASFPQKPCGCSALSGSRWLEIRLTTKATQPTRHVKHTNASSARKLHNLAEKLLGQEVRNMWMEMWCTRSSRALHGADTIR